MDPETAWYYGTCYAVAKGAGLARLLRDRDTKSIGYCVGVGFVSGFFGLAVVSICGGDGILDAGRGWFYLGVAALLGLAGPEQTKYIAAANRMMLNKLGIELEEDDE